MSVVMIDSIFFRFKMIQRPRPRYRLSRPLRPSEISNNKS